MSLDDLSKKIGYEFSDIKLLDLAITHKSADNKSNNERLEFLGDSIINLYVAERLLSLQPPLPEGRLTQIRASLVSRSTLNEIASSINLDDYILLGKGETTFNNSISGNTFEALIGAIYQDGSKTNAYKTLDKFFDSRIQIQLKEGSSKDAKSTLQEILQKQKFYSRKI